MTPEVDTELLEALADEGYPGLEGTTHQLTVLDSVEGTAEEWFSIPIRGLPGLVDKYIDFIMTGPTDVVCQCEWVIHPDDVDKPKGQRRRKRGQEHPKCMQHTKLGFLMGFFVYTFTPESADGDTT